MYISGSITDWTDASEESLLIDAFRARSTVTGMAIRGTLINIDTVSSVQGTVESFVIPHGVAPAVI